MIERARAGRSVVRLKGGDPFVFGRGGEEAEALAPPESRSRWCRASPQGSPRPPTPGFPSPTARTPRRSPSSPGTRIPAKDDSALDWDALARFPGTLVLYMGVKRLPEIAERLIAAGRDAGEPAAWSSEGRCRASEP